MNKYAVMLLKIHMVINFCGKYYANAGFCFNNFYFCGKILKKKHNCLGCLWLRRNTNQKI